MNTIDKAKAEFIDGCMEGLPTPREAAMRVLDKLLPIFREMTSNGNMDDYMSEYYPKIPRMLGLIE